MTELNPSESQRKAMLEKLADHSMWDREGMQRAVYEMIEVANSVPEGAPVGTIARRPDGAWIALMELCGKWSYKPFTNQGEWPQPSDADSWPVIYDPDEYHEGDKPRLERLMREPSVFEAHLTKLEVIEVLDALGRLDGTVKSAVKLLTGFSDERLEELGGFSDPTAQQEPGKGWLRQEFSKADKRSAEIPDRARPKVVRGTVEDALRPDDVELLETDPEEFVRRTAQQELVGVFAEAQHAEYVRAKAEFDAITPRIPRVRDRLGVDEQGARWRDVFGFVWSYGNGWWKTVDGGLDYGCVDPSTIRGPFKEILESQPEAKGESSLKSSPRVLPSLDCEEARDGAAWETESNTIRFRWRFTEKGWRCATPRHGACTRPSTQDLKKCGPYTEVLS